MSETVYVGMGSNLGDRERQLFLAVQALSRIDAAAVLRRSSLYESAAIGPPQPKFLNAVVEMECALTPHQLLSILKQIEIDLGRKPGERWGPRPIDLDIELWEGRTVAEVDLQIPHLELHQRRFVLEPLCELNPEARHPIFGKTVRELLNGVLRQDVVRLSSPDWPEATSGGTE